MDPKRVYAIGDIHGRLDKLIEVHEWISRDQAKNGPAPTVHLGDLTDRGPDSKGVIDYLLEGLDAGEEWVVLKGNHDRMMSWYLEEEPRRDHILRAQYEWLHPRLGGWETLESYGITASEFDLSNAEDVHAAARAKVPQSHRDFLTGLPVIFETNEVAIVHAGIRPGVKLSDQTEDDLIWIRDEFHFSRLVHEKLIIHGHTPVDEVTHYGNRINIDTGAAYGGPLSAIVIEGDEIAQVAKRGRKRIPRPKLRG